MDFGPAKGLFAHQARGWRSDFEA